MKDFTHAQKLLMALAVLAAVTFAVLMIVPGGGSAAPAPVAAPGGMMVPF